VQLPYNVSALTHAVAAKIAKDDASIARRIELCRTERERVYGYRFDGSWHDIGNHEQLLEADNRLRRLAGLPERESYSLD